jgi:hypothetical protein
MEVGRVGVDFMLLLVSLYKKCSLINSGQMMHKVVNNRVVEGRKKKKVIEYG